jgi:hypothetical protein
MVEQEILNTFISEIKLGVFIVINPVEQDSTIDGKTYETKEDAEQAFNEFIVRENIIFE